MKVTFNLRIKIAKDSFLYKNFDTELPLILEKLAKGLKNSDSMDEVYAGEKHIYDKESNLVGCCSLDFD